jgi:hypothetical protein
MIENQKFKKGEKVLLDAEYSNRSVVKVVYQSENPMYTLVTSNDVDNWEVMTYRLSKIKEQ